MSVFSPHSFDSTLLMPYVLEPALRALALAGAVWLLLAALRVRDVSFRLVAWTVVLYAALAMPLLGRLLPELPVLLPVKPAAQTVATPVPSTTTVAAVYSTSDRTTVPAIAVSKAASGIADATQSPAEETADFVPATTDLGRHTTAISWPAIAAGLYCALVGIFLGRLTLGLVLSGRLRRSSHSIQDERLEVLAVQEARKAGLQRVPRIAESSALSIPATLGVRHPVILLPPGWREWSETQIRAVLAHELSHVARHDALTQMTSKFYRAIFWFSPLSWLLDRALVDLAEQASDDAALRAGTDRTRYAEVLLHFFRALRTARGRVRWQAVSMAQGVRSARRLERVLAGSRLSRRLGQTAFAAVALSVVPLVCLAAAVQPSLSAAGQMPGPPVAPAPPRPPALAAIPAVINGPAESARVAPLPPVSPAKVKSEAAAPKAPSHWFVHERHIVRPPLVTLMVTRLETPAPVFLMEPPALPSPPRLAWFFEQQPKGAAAARAAARTETERWFSGSDCNGNEAFFIVSGSKITTRCGSPADFEHVRKLRSRISGSFIWFRRNGRSYIIRDPATVKAALNAFALQKGLTRQQAELGRQQARLGRKQAALGLRQSQVRATVPDLSAEMRQVAAAMQKLNFSTTQAQIDREQAKLRAALKALDSSATQEELGRAQAQMAAALRAFNSSEAQQALRQMQVEMARMQSRLGSLQAMAGKKQEAIGRQQAALGRRQEALGRRQAELGRRQAELARKAAQQVQRLIDQAIAHGLAKPE
jgi:beta-lactamase regulating signal transducer with metallopeptidase domain